MKQEEPGLGQFTAPLNTTVVAGTTGYNVTGIATFSPVTTPAGLRYNITGPMLLAQQIPIPTPPPIPTPVPVPVPVPTPTPTPTPPPGPVKNVRNYGAKGDGVADDTAACQRALQSAAAGDTVYFPAGVYRLLDQLKWNHPPQATIMGDGPTSILKSVAGQGLYIGTGGESGGPVTVKHLLFQGNHGATMQSAILPTGGIQIFGPQNCIIDDCDFIDVTTAVYDAAPTKGTTVTNCRITGWARIAFFLEQGALVDGCVLAQTDPNLPAQATSHGFYIHGGAGNVTVRNTSIKGVAKYAIQVYSEAPNTVTQNVTLANLTIDSCANGIIFAHSQPGAGEIVNGLIEGCRITNTFGGSALLIKDGDGVVVTNNVIDGCVAYGIGLGGWAPYEPNFSLTNVDVFGNTVRNCAVGLFGLASNGGTFSNCQFHDNAVSGNHQDVSVQPVAGLTYSP